MGVYIGIPGADYSASAAKIGTQAFPSDDPLPILSIPGLLNWWQGDDAVIASSIMSWTDRVQGKVLVAPDAAKCPTIITGDNGKKAVQFAGAQTLGGPVSVVNQVDTYTWVFVNKPANPLVTGAFVLAGGPAPARTAFQWADGKLSGPNASGVTTPSQAFSDALVTASVNKIIGHTYDAVNSKHGWSANGVFNKYSPYTVPYGPLAVATTFNIGASAALGNPIKADFYDLFLFDRDMHTPANLPYLSYLVAKMKSRYGIA